MLCNICPRKCNIDRQVNIGVCKSSDMMRIARANLHIWEEECVSGKEGSGTIFFTGCNLKCIYCQNYEISDGGNLTEISNETIKHIGITVTSNGLADIMLELQQKQANNINLVTGTHFVPQIIEAIDIAKSKGLTLPIVYNTSAYENVDTLHALKGYVDVYLPDFKYYNNEIAKKYSSAPDYREIATEAIDEMVRQCPKCSFDSRGIITNGVIIRHLVLPGHTNDSKKIIKYIHDRYKDDVYISIMSQYTPVRHIAEYPNLNRKLTKREYHKVVDYAINECNIENGYIQEGEVASESFIPDFDLVTEELLNNG